MAELSDTQIRSKVQQVLARHWIDMEKTNFLCARGVVRMLGEIRRAHATGVPIDAQKLEVIERDLQTVRGVRRVQYDFENWRRTEDGGWRKIPGRGTQNGDSPGSEDGAEPAGAADPDAEHEVQQHF